MIIGHLRATSSCHSSAPGERITRRRARRPAVAANYREKEKNRGYGVRGSSRREAGAGGLRAFPSIESTRSAVVGSRGIGCLRDRPDDDAGAAENELHGSHYLRALHHRALSAATRFDGGANITYAEKPRRRHSWHQINHLYLDTPHALDIQMILYGGTCMAAKKYRTTGFVCYGR
jgi:hypothetical protein